jgi:hypothetical protein
MFLATPDDDEDDQQFNTQFGHFLYNPIIIIIIIMLSNLGISCNPDT